MKFCTVCKEKYDDGVSFCPVDGEVLEDDPTSFVGSVLDGQYQIESLLGKGGMGAVYLARHILLGDRVAIKILPPEVRNNAEWLRRFRREGQAARRFRHANAVTVYDLRTAADGIIYMVMEYVDGHTLDAELKRRGRFTAPEALEILDPIMSVLNTAHAMGVVHRDLKPENIMIGKASTGGESQIKLLDLGIAKMREIAGVESAGTTELTIAGQVLGTPYYMSPEQWGEISRDGNPEVDGRTDIYSLGLVAYEMITGKRPYGAATLHELRREHIAVSPPPLCEKVPDVPRAFSEAIDRAISKDRDDRQPTAGDLAIQLRAGLGDMSSFAPVSRTVPDLPHPESAGAPTQGAPGGLNTKSDVNAATIVTVDAVQTSAPSQPPPNGPQRGYSGAAVAGKPEVVQFGDGNLVDLGSSVTIQQPPREQPRVQVELPARKKSRGKSLVFVGAGMLVLLLLVGGVGGFFAINWMRAKPSVTTADNSTDVARENNSAKAPTREIGRFTFEAENNPNGVRFSPAVLLQGEQGVKFHFKPYYNGYVYVIGPGVNDAPTIFLTAKPSPMSGLKTNAVPGAADFVFPRDTGTKANFLRFEDKQGSYEFTFVFSANPITKPAFFDGASEHELTADELHEWNNFRETASRTAVVPGDDTMFVKAAPDTQNLPVVFTMRIDHK